MAWVATGSRRKPGRNTASVSVLRRPWRNVSSGLRCILVSAAGMIKKTLRSSTIASRNPLTLRQTADRYHYLPDRLSSLVLGIEADGLKQALIELFVHRDKVPSARVVNVVHDEVLVECDEHQAPEVAAWLQKRMERGMLAALKGKALTPVEVQVGQSWAGS